MDIAALVFTATLLPPVSAINGCKGCVFSSERVAVCRQINVIAVRAGLPDCDDTPGGKRVIYTLPALDERQLSLLGSATASI